MRDIVDISQFTQVQLPQRDVSPSPSAPEPDPDTRIEDQQQFNDFSNIGDDFGSLDDDFGVARESLEEKYEDGLTFLDVFDADEFAEYRKDNLFYPFASKEEWEVADYLLRSSLSMAAIDEFLKLRMRDPVECLESLFSNPLFHDKLNFVPCRMYKTAAQLLRVYSEWLTGNSAWDTQSQYPIGATILGAVLSSDKTNITTMTGARITHPLLLGLANISFMLTALLPIPKYLHPNQWMRGMLEDRLVHKCLSIVLKPLMIAAEVGIMMSDPLASITVDPNDLEAYFEACAEHQLNGVHAPFWKGYPHADPSIFLMPEPLHHWHKEFYDHDLQWCLKVVGAQELDFRFSILQPITGYRHFVGGISKLKQVTGRVHRNIQHYIVGLISGVAPCRFMIAIRALMDVRYLAQCPAPDNNLLSSIDQSLLTFHENKNVIMTLGARMGAKKPINNWFIPKLELLQSITSSTRKVGALIQWSADATEHAHVSEIKDPVRHTNNNNYDPQICCYLDRQEKLYNPVDVAEENEGEEDNIDHDEWELSDPQTALLEEMNQTRITTNYFSKATQFDTLSHRQLTYPPRTFIGGTTAIHLNYDPSCNGVKVGDISVDYNILDLHFALSDFLQRDARGRGIVHEVTSRRRLLIDHPPIIPFDRVQVWHSVRLQQTSFHDSSIVLPAQTVHASPSGPGWPKGRWDFVLVNIDGAAEWPKSGLTVKIPHLHRIKWRDQYLCYVQCLSIGPIDPATEMHTLKCAKHADGSSVGNFIPLNQLHAFISIIPRLGDVADARLTKATSSHYSHSFFLNKYFDKEIYNAIYYASR
ncbi:uncharacterized protein F5891DRAFT_1131119 [Suillus fuscotomentosus]|uniref:DUF6830 domain-containing protein n=1 Tax=Suillus fuscotomentosus TaxID=1912939 RepID=A0AAD4HET7_9AGAM|nr:uncharacterized protein F5891DRAFT_1131119 [Suillus fuscotomentosus]KAG1893892.1 hypothetical protein F5891DRAFT_1131119 [Suillus fuscotomentosus]